MARPILVLLPLGLAALLVGVGVAALAALPAQAPGPSVGSPSPVAALQSTAAASTLPSLSPNASPSTQVAAPTPSATASPTPGGPRPSPVATPSGPVAGAPHDPVKFGFAAKGMRGEVMAFATIPELAYARDTLDYSAVSTLVFFSLQAGADGALLHDSRWRAWNGSVFDAVRDRAHAAGTRVVVAVSRFSWAPDQAAITGALLGSSAHQ